MRHVFYAIAIAAGFTSPVFAAEMQSGSWETDIVTQTPGEKPQDMKMTRCMTKEEVQAQMGPAGAGASSYEMDDGTCKTKSVVKDGTSTFDSDCKSGEKSSVVMTYTPEGYTMKSTSTSGGQTTTTTMAAKRVGGC